MSHETWQGIVSGRRWFVPLVVCALGCGSTAKNADATGAGTGGGGASNGAAGLGGAQGGSVNQAGSANEAGSSSLGGGVSGTGGECSKADCGQQIAIPNWTCEDGTQGGPTGRCIRRSNGSCGWEIHQCPPAGQGGSASQGGQGNTAGEPAGGGATTDCGGCAQSEVCVFQVGGPGASRFVCATQNPCGAVGACSCIVGQGVCQPNLMGDPPRYCSCDSGTD